MTFLLALTMGPFGHYLTHLFVLGLVVGIPLFLVGIWIGRIIFNRNREACDDGRRRRHELVEKRDRLASEFVRNSSV